MPVCPPPCFWDFVERANILNILVLLPLDEAATCCLQVDDDVEAGHHAPHQILLLRYGEGGELGALGGLAGFFGGRASLCVPDFNREPSKIIIHENMGAVAIVGMKSLGVTWTIIYIDTMLMYLPLKLLLQLLRGPCRPRWRLPQPVPTYRLSESSC